MKDEPSMIEPKQLEFEDGISRIASVEMVATMFQGLPDVTGINHVQQYKHDELIAQLRTLGMPIYESGPQGLAVGYGIYVVLSHRKLGRGQLFIQTDPLLKLPENILTDPPRTQN